MPKGPGDTRRSDRYVVTETILVVVESEKQLESGTLVNVSARGTYVATTAELGRGELVVLTVHIPYGSGVSFRLNGVVSWSDGGQQAGRRHREGYGFDFLADRETQQNAIELLQHLSARNALIKLPT